MGNRSKQAMKQDRTENRPLELRYLYGKSQLGGITQTVRTHRERHKKKEPA